MLLVPVFTFRLVAVVAILDEPEVIAYPDCIAYVAVEAVDEEPDVMA